MTGQVTNMGVTLRAQEQRQDCPRVPDKWEVLCWRVYVRLLPALDIGSARLRRWKNVCHSLNGYMQTLRTKKTCRDWIADFGQAMRRQPDGSWVPGERTIARSKYRHRLEATYPGWVEGRGARNIPKGL